MADGRRHIIFLVLFEFLGKCGDKVRNIVVDECRSAVFFSTIVDVTPDNSRPYRAADVRSSL